METEHTLRQRIKTVADIRAIVRTMKALAAVNGRQYEAVLKSLDEYTQTIDMGLQVALRGRVFHKPSRKQAPLRLAAVIFGSDIGLCGRFNEDLTGYAIDKMNGFHVPLTERSVLAVGSRIDARLSELGHPVEETFMTPGSPAAITFTVREILRKLDEWQNQSIEQVLLFYSHSGSPHLLHLLPVDLRQFSHLTQEPWPSRILPCYSLDAEHLLAALVRQHLFVCLFRACTESLTSENQMRLRTMQAAEKNIQDRLDDLVFDYRNRRQDAIDAELLDIGAGFEAIMGQQ
ncbi:MAG: F0F1 ATP synthase subunit gamma [Methylococcaceae bacterium]|nr:F0F1 ATP synthase subunit gamma [Methylococcaceae bacterium]